MIELRKARRACVINLGLFLGYVFLLTEFLWSGLQASELIAHQILRILLILCFTTKDTSNSSFPPNRNGLQTEFPNLRLTILPKWAQGTDPLFSCFVVTAK